MSFYMEQVVGFFFIFLEVGMDGGLRNTCFGDYDDSSNFRSGEKNPCEH